MSKLAQYLAEHMRGDVSARPSVVAAYAHDGGVLEKRPEMVATPMSTADVRKVATFCWQLAEKGHHLGLTVRGAGTSVNGASLAKGVIVDMTTHMHRVYEYEPKQQLARLQPGVSVGSLANALALQGTDIALLRQTDPRATLGGVVSEGFSGVSQAKYGTIDAAVAQLEVVLANGDVMQTGPLSQREFNAKKGLDTFEGEIYRKLDVLLQENASLLEAGAPADKSGYPGIFAVKQKKRYDLTPLFVGAEGTLGIITEMIMRTGPLSDTVSAGVVLFDEKTEARDAASALAKLAPSFMQYIDGELFQQAAKNGKKFDELGPDVFAAAIVLGFDDPNPKNRQKQLKKLKKLLPQARIVTLNESHADMIAALGAIADSAFTSETESETWPPLFEHFYIPSERLEQFVGELDGLTSKYNFSLPLTGDLLSETYTTRPLLFMRRVADKQKIFKLIDELGAIIARSGGSLVGDGGEGRLLAPFAQKQLDPQLRDVYAAVKTIFDPHGILAPGVKDPQSLRDTVAMLRNDY